MLEKNMALLHSGLGKDPVTKSDEFLEKFQTAFDTPPLIFGNYVALFLVKIRKYALTCANLQ